MAVDQSRWKTRLSEYDGESFIARLRENGWAPADAFIAYTEWRKFAAPEIRADVLPGSPQESAWNAGSRLMQALESMTRPSDWKVYVNRWADLAAGVVDWQSAVSQPTSDVVTYSQRQKAAEDWLAVRWMEKDEIISRLSGIFAYKELPAWSAVREVGMGWDDVDETLAREKMELPPVPNPKKTDGVRALLEAAQRAGLRALSWPAANGASAATLAALGQQVTQVNDEMAKATGMTGPVLGINGRVEIQMGRLVDGTSAYCAESKTPVIATRVDSGWGPVAHEWLHGLDAVLGRTEGRDAAVSEQIQARQVLPKSMEPWKKLLTALRRPSFNLEEQEALAVQLVEGLVARHANNPSVRALLIEGVDQLGGADFDRKKWLSRLETHTRKPADDATLASLRAEVVLTEMEMVAQARRERTVGGSPWVQFARRFDANLTTHHREGDVAKTWTGYYAIPAEQLAHSFEATLPEGSLGSDVGGLKRPIQYPLPLEAEKQKTAWKEFFKEMAPWWCAEVGLTAPVASVGARLSARRQRQSQLDMAEPAPPLAARARPG